MPQDPLSIATGKYEQDDKFSELLLDQQEAAKKDAAAKKKSMDDALGKIADFEANGWYRHNAYFAKEVKGLQDFVAENVKNGINPTVPNAENPEYYLEYSRRKKLIEREAEYSEQIKSEYAKDMSVLEAPLSYKDGQVDSLGSWYKLGPKEMFTTPKPQVTKKPEFTDWHKKYSNYALEKYRGYKKQEERFASGDRTTITKPYDRDAIQRAIESDIKNTEEGKAASRDNGGDEAAVKYIMEEIIDNQLQPFEAVTYEQPSSGKGLTEKDFLDRNDIIRWIQNGDPRGFKALNGAKYEGGTVSNARLEDGKVVADIIYGYDTSTGAQKKLKDHVISDVSFEAEGGYGELNNMLNTVGTKITNEQVIAWNKKRGAHREPSPEIKKAAKKKAATETFTKLEVDKLSLDEVNDTVKGVTLTGYKPEYKPSIWSNELKPIKPQYKNITIGKNDKGYIIKSGGKIIQDYLSAADLKDILGKYASKTTPTTTGWKKPINTPSFE